MSKGSVNLTLTANNVRLRHEFLVIDGFESGMHGVIGSDFLHKHSANINFEDFTFSFSADNNKITIPIQSKFSYFTTIPARCEIIKYFWVDTTEDCIVIPDELAEGVFIAGTLGRPHDNMIPVRILNVRNEEIKLKNFTPKISYLKDYEVCSFNTNNVSSIDRIDTVLNSLSMEHLNREEKHSLEKICAKYSDRFHLENEPLNVSNIYKQRIRLQPSATPTYVKPYRLPQSQKKEVDRQIDNMLKNGIIEEATSEWSAPLLIVPKKPDNNGTQRWRLVIDYRFLNKQVKDDKFPLPCITEILDSLSGAMYFSHLDLAQGYYQIELEEHSRPYTAFTTDKGQYQMTRLPMGLKISPSAFSRAMTIAMAGLNYNNCFIYLDDLIVFGNNLTNHNKNLVKVLERLRQVNLKLNPTKCDFLRKEILYLGHIISSEGVSPDPNKIKVLLQYPKPKNADETKRFVAFANYYRRYIPNFSSIAAPLNSLTKKGVTFTWTSDCQKAFETLKHSLTTPPILQYPNFSPNNSFILKTDASGHAIGAVLCNADDRPVAFASRSLNKAERNYCTIEKELVAIVWAVKHFRPYLYGRKFQILTDHRPLIYLFGMANPSSRLTKFRLTLEEYDFTINYLKGKDNVTADMLSRVELSINDLKNLQNSVDGTINVITRAKSKRNIHDTDNTNSNNDTFLPDRLDHPGAVELLKRPENSFELRLMLQQEFEEILKTKAFDFTQNNLIFNKEKEVIYLKETRSTAALRASLRELVSICLTHKIRELVIIKNTRHVSLLNDILKENVIKTSPIKISVINNIQNIDEPETRQLILNDFHILANGGHAGINRMYNNIKKYYFWTGLRKDVISFVTRCDDCQRYKYSKPNKREPLTITTTASSAFQTVYLDIVGPIEPDFNENKYILTIQCDLTKFIEAYPLPNKESKTVATEFVKNFILRYGIPGNIITDQGAEFLASLFVETCKILNIKQLHSTAYHHQTLGALENSHKWLGAYLRTQTARHPNAWSSWVPFWCFSYNNTVHTITRYTPYELIFGKTCRLPLNICHGIDPLYNFNSYPLELKYRLQQAWNDAKNNLIASKVDRKISYDRNTSNVNYEVGDLILLKNNPTSKLDELYKGPYEVIQVKTPNIVIREENKLVEVHKDRIKHYCK